MWEMEAVSGGVHSGGVHSGGVHSGGVHSGGVHTLPFRPRSRLLVRFCTADKHSNVVPASGSILH